MAVNPNANPIFNVPGSAARVEFGDGPTKQEDRGGSSNVKSKNGKLLFGKKFNKSSKNKIGTCGNDNNDNCGNDVSSMSSGSATATMSPNSSLHSSFGKQQHNAAPALPTNGILTEAMTSLPQQGKNKNWSHLSPKKQRAPEKKSELP